VEGGSRLSVIACHRGATAERAFCFEPCATPRHIKVRAMSSWLVPPIVIPVLIVILVVVYGLYRAYS
jgi:hypothetical protein